MPNGSWGCTERINYVSVMKQLDDMGVREYSIFDPTRDYPRKRKPVACGLENPGKKKEKKYHTGYIAGAFDLFHVGHLNMFKRVKEQHGAEMVFFPYTEGTSSTKIKALIEKKLS